MTKEKEIVAATKILVIGTRPSHEHLCGHTCNSPYCDEPKNVPCENCGGPESIAQGREPWRGR